MVHTCVGPQTLRWPTAPHFLNPSLDMTANIPVVTDPSFQKIEFNICLGFKICSTVLTFVRLTVFMQLWYFRIIKSHTRVFE